MVQVANLQSLLVRRSNKPLYAVLLFRFSETASGRNFIRELLPRVLSGASAEVPGTATLNIFVSWRAIAALAAGYPALDPAIGQRQFEASFTDPMQGPGSLALADQLGFAGPSAPDNWWSGFRSEDIDIAMYVGSDTEGQRREILSQLRAAAQRASLTELTLPSFSSGAIEGYLPPGGRLHFGYRDGITSPNVDWNDAGGPGTVDFREFLMGYPSNDYPTTPYAAGPWRDFAKDGSFACLTWIHQDVAGFESFLTESAPEIASLSMGVDPKEWLAAQLMGRWRDGSPLARYPDAPPQGPDLNDAFGYADDPGGARCPLGAHIRVAYCRDQPFNFPNASRFPKGPPRLIRRGFSYGETLVSATDDGRDRGLCGLFLCARVNEQFYTVLRWMQQTEFSDAFDVAKPGRAGQDRLTGSRLPGGSNRLPDSNIVLTRLAHSAQLSLRSFIRYRGVAVLFLPSMATLRDILAR